MPLAQDDAILLPICHKVSYYGAGSAECFARACREAEHLSRRTGLPVVVQGASADLSDLVGEMRLPLSNFLYFNPAIIDTALAERLHAHVYFVPDYLQKYYDGRVDPVETPGCPTVSFWGVCAPFAQRWSKTRVADYARYALSHLDSIGLDRERIVRRFGNNMKHAHRARVVSSIRAYSKIQFDLRLQPVCVGGGLSMVGSGSKPIS